MNTRCSGKDIVPKMTSGSRTVTFTTQSASQISGKHRGKHALIQKRLCLVPPPQVRSPAIAGPSRNQIHLLESHLADHATSYTRLYGPRRSLQLPWVLRSAHVRNYVGQPCPDRTNDRGGYNKTPNGVQANRGFPAAFPPYRVFPLAGFSPNRP